MKHLNYNLDTSNFNLSVSVSFRKIDKHICILLTLLNHYKQLKILKNEHANQKFSHYGNIRNLSAFSL